MHQINFLVGVWADQKVNHKVLETGVFQSTVGVQLGGKFGFSFVNGVEDSLECFGRVQDHLLVDVVLDHE